jgi:hypothetical protein
MKHFIALWCVLALPVLAQEAPIAPDGDDPRVVDWEQLRARATDLHGRAKQMRFQADRTRDDATAYCRDRILVASCMEDARKARHDAERAIRRIEQEARQIELRLRAHEHEIRLERRAEKNLEQEAKAAERAEELRQQDERRRLKNEKRAVDEERRRRKALRE